MRARGCEKRSEMEFLKLFRGKRSKYRIVIEVLTISNEENIEKFSQASHIDVWMCRWLAYVNIAKKKQEKKEKLVWM